MRRTRDAGIRAELGTEVQGLVVLGARDGQARRFETDLAVHVAGRVPEIDDLDLRAAGVEREKRGVSNPALHAGGDAAAGGPPLTPKADHDAALRPGGVQRAAAGKGRIGGSAGTDRRPPSSITGGVAGTTLRMTDRWRTIAAAPNPQLVVAA